MMSLLLACLLSFVFLACSLACCGVAVSWVEEEEDDGDGLAPEGGAGVGRCACVRVPGCRYREWKGLASGDVPATYSTAYADISAAVLSLNLALVS